VLLSSHEGGKETAEALWVAVGLEVWARQSLCR
jgi:hypothetical protein